MTPKIRRIAVNTGGGDAPGLNAVIRAVTLSALRRGWEVIGLNKAYDGLIDPTLITPLTRESVRGITQLGGTILGTTNRGDPFHHVVVGPDGVSRTEDISTRVLENFKKLELDALVAIGGDGSLRIAHHFSQSGMPIVGVPKTIDNDLEGTEVTFGFNTAVYIATEALERLHTTAQSHERVMVVEVMGRDAGWIALHSGLASTSDVILIPEIPFEWEPIYEKVRERDRIGRRFTIIVVAEGAKPKGGVAVVQAAATAGKMARLGGIGELVAEKIREHTGKDTRSLVLGHLQRGGGPNSFDRLLALRLGAHAVRMVAEGKFGMMAALQCGRVTEVPFEVVTQCQKLVPLDGDTVQTARDLGICFGD